MNIKQKIKFLKHRRHMDAMRIKRLKRHIDISLINNMITKKIIGEAESLISPLRYAFAGPNARDLTNTMRKALPVIKEDLKNGNKTGAFATIKQTERDIDFTLKHYKNELDNDLANRLVLLKQKLNRLKVQIEG